MDSLLEVSPGLMIWTLVNFFIFFAILLRFGLKPMLNGLRKRETSIADALSNAERINNEAQALLKESQAKMSQAQHEMMNIIKEGRVQAENLRRQALEESEVIKTQKVEEARREIEREKENALRSLRTQVAGMVVMATGKLIGQQLNDESHLKLVESFVDQVANN